MNRAILGICLLVMVGCGGENHIPPVDNNPSPIVQSLSGEYEFIPSSNVQYLSSDGTYGEFSTTSSCRMEVIISKNEITIYRIDFGSVDEDTKTDGVFNSDRNSFTASARKSVGSTIINYEISGYFDDSGWWGRYIISYQSVSCFSISFFCSSVFAAQFSDRISIDK